MRVPASVSLIAAGLMCLSSGAGANLIEHHSFFFSLETDVNTHARYDRDTVSAVIPHFDPLLGDLTGIVVSVDSNIDHTTSGNAVDDSAEFFTRSYRCGSGFFKRTCYYRVYNNDTWVRSNSRVTSTIQLSGASTLENVRVDDHNTAYCRDAYTGSGTSRSSSCTAHESDVGNALDRVLFSSADPAILQSLLNASPLRLTVSLAAGLGISCDQRYASSGHYSYDTRDLGDRCGGSASGNWSGNIRTAYSYTERAAVPLTDTLSLLSIGALGLLFGARRRRLGADSPASFRVSGDLNHRHGS